MNKFLIELRTKAWRTSSARYNAARRLKFRDWLATFSIAMFSVIGVGLAVVQKVYKFDADSPADRYVTVLSVAIGLFVIVISLIEWGFSGAIKADALYRNAEQLNNLQLEIAQALAGGREIEGAEATELRKRYESIKDACPYNHEPVDDALFRSKQRLSPEFLNTKGDPTINWITARFAELSAFWHAVKTFVFFWLVIVVLLLFLIRVAQ